MDIQTRQQLEQAAYRVRRSVLHMAYAAGDGGAHLGGSLSCVEILTVLYTKVLAFNPDRPDDPDRDRFLAGKAHCSLARYSVLKELGAITEKEQYSFQEDGGPLVGHQMNQKLGQEYAGGSLGMALSVAVGMALDAKQKQKKHKIYVLLGDGECDEGIIWEAVMAANQYRLDNLVAVVDRNRLQLSGTVDEVMELGDLGEKFRAFGWHVQEADGHDVEALAGAFAQISCCADKPHAVIAHTVKGKGVSFMENKVEWHQHVLTEPCYRQALAELEAGRYEDENGRMV